MHSPDRAEREEAAGIPFPNCHSAIGSWPCSSTVPLLCRKPRPGLGAGQLLATVAGPEGSLPLRAAHCNSTSCSALHAYEAGQARPIADWKPSGNMTCILLFCACLFGEMHPRSSLCSLPTPTAKAENPSSTAQLWVLSYIAAVCSSCEPDTARREKWHASWRVGLRPGMRGAAWHKADGGLY